MTDRLPLNRFQEFGALSQTELRAIVALGNPALAFEKRATIRPEGIVPTSFFLLLEGWAKASIILPDGSRQIVKVHLPGDALGTPSMCVTRTVEILTAITPVFVSEVPFERFGKLFEDHPRIAAQFMLTSQLERVALMDQLASVGRTSAEARVASLLIDLLERLEAIGLASNGMYRLPLTQEQLGDITGLTSVHINRTLRDLRARGLIAQQGQHMTILDRQKLGELAARPVRTLNYDAPWVPAGR
ncbi:Crp/Fnr family transcriptional regulator [Sphingomonas sp. HF-S4]|uniref:Crp/Fnr family transcriptional regulator n=1 Tax=Sphingomonas agrestis TaxID=3080540 RepID=A0ABU3Y786_9SPHN|nr:Crp/Fnr family transcriptional regulator [Sphingomonas sp. HF-S4]MDV3457266.1 Crp/Fnr family transcriptional regulator [Sphingomonas sp. HF-S4]